MSHLSTRIVVFGVITPNDSCILYVPFARQITVLVTWLGKDVKTIFLDAQNSPTANQSIEKTASTFFLDTHTYIFFQCVPIIRKM